MSLFEGIGELAGALLGRGAASGDLDQQDKYSRRAAEELMSIVGPEYEDFTPEELEYLGDLVPQLEQEILLGPSAYEDISIDPRLRAEQMAALEQVAELSEGGLTDADLAALQQIRRGAAQSAQSQQEAILQNLQQRGQGGAGAELIARLQSAQSAADREGSMGMEIAQMAQQRALQAMSDRANLSGNIRQQDFSEEERIAQARDVINQFNTRNQVSRQQRNVDRGNVAQERNLGLQQDIANRNVGLRNQTQLTNNDIERMRFLDNLRAAEARSGGAGMEAGRYGSRAGNTIGSAAQIGGGLGSIGDAAVGAITGGAGLGSLFKAIQDQQSGSSGIDPDIQTTDYRMRRF